MWKIIVGLMFARIMGAQDWSVQLVGEAQTRMAAVVDTARTENPLCLGVDVDSSAHTVTVWQVQAAKVLRRATRDMTRFECPAGAGIAHLHFLARKHVDGASDVDAQTARQLRVPVALVVVVDEHKQAHYVVYAP